MRKHALTILVFGLSLFSAYGQQPADTTIHRQRAIIGFHGGILFSSLDFMPNYWYSFEMTENYFRPGGLAGISVSLINSKNFSIQPELSFQMIHHDLKYSNVDEEPESIEYTHADYSLTLLTLQTSVLFKVRTGKKFMTYIGIGPYASIPIYHSYDGELERAGHSSTISSYDTILYNNDIDVAFSTTIGGLIATGINVPFRNNNFGIEFRYYISPGKLIKSPAIRQSYISLSLTYQFISKKNVW